MKILFFGHKGWIGSQIIQQWKLLYPNDEIILSNTKVIPSNESILLSEIQQVDRVFSSIGRTSGVINGHLINNIDYLESNLNENIRDNLYAPLLLAILCMKSNIHLSYIGTGCIFSKDTTTDEGKIPYIENSYPDFFGSSYSIVKGYTDNIMRFMNVANFRIRMPITNEIHPKNFITKIANFKQICSLPNSMTYLPNCIPEMIRLSKEQYIGTVNMVNPDYISHQEILTIYKNIFDPYHTCEYIDQHQLSNILLSKRSNNILQSSNFLHLKPIKDCITEAISHMKNNLSHT